MALPGMFTVQDVIHLIQYYYHTSSWEGAAADVEQIRLQSIRGELQTTQVSCTLMQEQISKKHWQSLHPLSYPSIPSDHSTTLVASLYGPMPDDYP